MPPTRALITSANGIQLTVPSCSCTHTARVLNGVASHATHSKLRRKSNSQRITPVAKYCIDHSSCTMKLTTTVPGVHTSPALMSITPYLENGFPWLSM